MQTLNVLYQSSNSYAPVTGVSLTSLLSNNQNINELNIYLLNDNISNENLNKFKSLCDKYNRNLFIIDTQEILDELVSLGLTPFNGSYTTYFKLLAMNKIKFSNSRVLQLDSDTIINDSLKDICDIDLSNYLLAATYDCTMNDYKKLIDIPLTDKFYNCGVLYINQEKWINEKCYEKIVYHLNNVRNKYYTVDQDILNVLFRKEFKYLDLKYNFNSGFYIYGISDSLKMYNLNTPYYDSYSKIKEAYDNPIIYHCMGAMTGRPWENDSIHPQNELFSQYKNISPWKNEPKTTIKRKPIFRIQRWMYLHLPRGLYMKLHIYAQHRYLNSINNKIMNNH